uniref:Uncharacterized protein n=1 Tax=Heterorhabditis bacteriophora TaxID=37862 RepID=A0A1I7WBI1_HETBA
MRQKLLIINFKTASLCCFYSVLAYSTLSRMGLIDKIKMDTANKTKIFHKKYKKQLLVNN